MARMTKAGVLAVTTSGISLVIGALTGHILTKKYIINAYEGVIEEQVTKAKAFYSHLNKTGEFSDPVALAERLTGDADEKVDSQVRPIEDESDDDYIVVDGKPFRETLTPEERVNYNKMSENYTGPAVERQTYIQDPVMPEDGESMAEYEQRVIDAAKERVNAIVERVGTETNSEREEVVVSNIFETNGVPPMVVDTSFRGTGRPYIITLDEFNENEGDYTQTTVTYYQGDNVLADDREQPISNANGVIGDSNLQFGNGSEDPNVVLIRNDTLEVDFEVCLSPGTYSEEVLGVAPTERKRSGRL